MEYYKQMQEDIGADSSTLALARHIRDALKALRPTEGEWHGLEVTFKLEGDTFHVDNFRLHKKQAGDPW